MPDLSTPRSWNDLGNALRVVDVHRKNLIYNVERGCFYRWLEEAQRWERMEPEDVSSLISDRLSNLKAEEQAYASDPDMLKKFRTWCTSQGNSGPLAGCYKLLVTRPELRRDKDFDSDPYILNTPAGPLDVEAAWNATATKQTSARELLCSRRTNATFHNQGDAPIWNAFLRDVLPDPAHRAFFQRLCGLMLVGMPVIQAFVIHYGNGGNGKGVALGTMCKVLGDYAYQASPVDFQRADTRKFHTKDWEGRRLLFVDEFSQRMDVEFVKTATGGSDIPAEVKHGKSWSYKPQFNLHFATNNIPVMQNEFAMERRFILMHWPTKNPSSYWTALANKVGNKDDIPSGFVEKEGHGILNWMLEGLEDFNSRPGAQLDKLGVPADLQAKAKDKLESDDPVAMFLRQCIEPTPDGKGRILQGAMYDAYVGYFHEYEDPSLKPMGKQAFNRLLKEDQYGMRHNGSDSNPAWLGVQFKPKGYVG